MARIDLPHIQRFKDRHGHLRHYFRKPGCKRVALPGVPGSEEFMAAYKAALGTVREVGWGRHKRGKSMALCGQPADKRHTGFLGEFLRVSTRSRQRKRKVSEAGWRPIETAPKKFIPFGDAGDGCWHTGWMVCGRFGAHGWVSWVGMLDADSWLGRDDMHCCFDTDPPTHWMPLPEPPNA